MQKTPVYVGIFVEDQKVASKSINNYVREALNELLDSQQEQDHLIYNDINNFQKSFKSPPDNYHITTLYLGGNTKKLNPKQNKNFQSFKHNQKAALKMDFIVYIPGYIICTYCSDTEGVQVDNKFPHVTLFLGDGAKAVQSNMVIESLAEKNPQIFLKKEFNTGKYEIDFNNFKSAYVINKRLDLKGVTGNNFTHGRK